MQTNVTCIRTLKMINGKKMKPFSIYLFYSSFKKKLFLTTLQKKCCKFPFWDFNPPWNDRSPCWTLTEEPVFLCLVGEIMWWRFRISCWWPKLKYKIFLQYFAKWSLSHHRFGCHKCLNPFSYFGLWHLGFSA